KAPVVHISAQRPARDVDAQVHALTTAGEEDAIARIVGVPGGKPALGVIPPVAQDRVGNTVADIVDVDILETIVQAHGGEWVDRLAEIDVKAVVLLRVDVGDVICVAVKNLAAERELVVK